MSGHIQYASYENRSARLADDFGRELLFKKAGEKVAEAILQVLPLYVRGPRKGKVKGYICWRHVSEGGWVKLGPGYRNGTVYRPGNSNFVIKASLVLSEGIDFLNPLTFDESEEKRIERITQVLKDTDWKQLQCLESRVYRGY